MRRQPGAERRLARREPAAEQQPPEEPQTRLAAGQPRDVHEARPQRPAATPMRLRAEQRSLAGVPPPVRLAASRQSRVAVAGVASRWAEPDAAAAQRGAGLGSPASAAQQARRAAGQPWRLAPAERRA